MNDYITAANGGDLHHAATPLRRAVAPKPQRSPNPHAHPSPPSESNRLVRPGQASLDAIHPFLPNIIPATRTNKATNESTKPPEGPAAGHLRATNLRKSASADREGQV